MVEIHGGRRRVVDLDERQVVGIDARAGIGGVVHHFADDQRADARPVAGRVVGPAQRTVAERIEVPVALVVLPAAERFGVAV